MILDAHCHIDQFPDPTAVAHECEAGGIVTVAVTNLPSHYLAGRPHVERFRHVKLALGLHPLAVGQHSSELGEFLRLLPKASYVGEVGLDFSKEGLPSKDAQLVAFRQIAAALQGERKRLVSLHSRRAEEAVLAVLLEEKVPAAVFHWYSGPLNVLDRAVDAGYYFSVNPAMVQSANGRKVVDRIPRERVLTETDGPYVKVGGRPAKPADVRVVLEHLATAWIEPLDGVAGQIEQNFGRVVVA